MTTSRIDGAAPGARSRAEPLAEATRRHPAVALGMSPRATLGLKRAVQVRAAAQGRDEVRVPLGGGTRRGGRRFRHDGQGSLHAD